MRRLITEYGRLVITIIALLGFFTLLGVLLANKGATKNSIVGIYKDQSQDSSAVYNNNFYSAVVGDIVESSTAPYFVIGNNAEFNITSNQITYDRLLQGVSIKYKGQDITKSTSIDGKKITKAIIVYSYKPSIIPPSGTDVNGTIEMEEVYAKDKYGHYIYQDANGFYSTDDEYNPDTGVRVTITQPKMLISDAVECKPSNYIDCKGVSKTDCSRQYKVVYRVQVGQLKAECSAMYIKNNDGVDVNVSGKTPLSFNYPTVENVNSNSNSQEESKDNSSTP